MRGVAGGIDAHRMFRTAAHLNKFTLSSGSDSAFAARLFNKLPAFQRINVTGRLAVNKMKQGLVKLFRKFIHFLGFFQGLFCCVAAQNGVLHRPSPLSGLQGQIMDAVAASNNTRNLTGIGGGKAHDLAILIQIRHFYAEAVSVGTNGFNIFLNYFFCFFLHICPHSMPSSARTRGINPPYSNVLRTVSAMGAYFSSVLFTFTVPCSRSISARSPVFT